LFGTAQPCSQFVQLQVWEVQIAERTLVQRLCVFPSASQPGADRGLTKIEDPRGRRRIQPFGQRREDHRDLLGRRFQPVQRGIAPRSECGTARLTTERLDALSLPMQAIANERMKVCICLAEVLTLLISTGEALRVYAFWSSA